jgi:hypothetical protein
MKYIIVIDPFAKNKNANEKRDDCACPEGNPNCCAPVKSSWSINGIWPFGLGSLNMVFKKVFKNVFKTLPIVNTNKYGVLSIRE